MSSKVSNIIAIELAILIGLMSWMACFLYSHLPSARRTTAAIQERAADRVATAAPVSEARNRRPYAVDYRSRLERAPPLYEEPAKMAPEYDQDYQDIGTEPGASARLEDNSIVGTSQPYAVVQPADVASPRNVPYQQPAQDVEYEQPEEIVEYQQSPQIVFYEEAAPLVAYSNSRRFAKRIRSTPRDFASITAMPQFPPEIGTHRQNVREFMPGQNVSGFVTRQSASGFVTRQNASGFVPGQNASGFVPPRRNLNAPSGRPVQGFRPGKNR